MHPNGGVAESYRYDILYIGTNFDAPNIQLELFRQLAHYYGIQIDDSLFHAEDSTVSSLRNELNGLKTAWQFQAELAQKQELEKINNEIQTFINDPANKHFNALQHDTARLVYRDWETDRKSTRLNSSHSAKSRMPSSA